MMIADLRRDYQHGDLLEPDMEANPLRQFALWLQQALAASLPEPNAMTLATVSAAGQPAARTVLLRGYDERGFVFYTNYDSRKGEEIAANPRVALLFFWPELERQVRIEGMAAPVAPEESDAYFRTRPHGSRLGAWASRQSAVIPGRGVLEAEMEALAAKYPGDDVPRPPHWGGYRVMPTAIEFWQGRPNRLHDRLRYLPVGDGWRLERLAP